MPLLTTHIPSDSPKEIGHNIRDQRLRRNWTQKTLSQKSGVSLSTLRKFEQTGKISLESFVQLCFCLGILDDVMKSTELKNDEFTSMDQVLKNTPPATRKRASRDKK